MYYRGPSRILWFTFGAFAATWYHRAHARGEFRGWGPCGNRRIEEWRAERAAEAAMKDQSTNTASQQTKNENIGEWSWRSATPPSPEGDEVRRRWDDKTRKAQETVADLSDSALDGILVAAETLKARLAEFRRSQRQMEDSERRTPPEESKSRHLV
ncbi:hypothetical protein BDM02DRAFT_3186517 [Thelephora ganbajun]|uniref:Uncharacterized protein n=1 Tax=Thelephora ganbajun TaxID=370292 RepID=A0ACB6ZHS4_THEGA|nr:hypothetical protein BDM02DRAFT_3186517 [Thelephora ganbajun]